MGELVQHRETGFVISEYSVDSLRHAIETAAEKKKNKSEYLAMREKCCKYAKENFSWDMFVKKCIESMGEALEA